MTAVLILSWAAVAMVVLILRTDYRARPSLITDSAAPALTKRENRVVFPPHQRVLRLRLQTATASQGAR